MVECRGRALTRQTLSRSPPWLAVWLYPTRSRLCCSSWVSLPNEHRLTAAFTSPAAAAGTLPVLTRTLSRMTAHPFVSSTSLASRIMATLRRLGASSAFLATSREGDEPFDVGSSTREHVLGVMMLLIRECAR